MTHSPQRVVVLGASPKPERYSNRAIRLLRQHGHEVIPVHPAAEAIEGIPVVHDLADVEGHVDTITLYVSAAISDTLTSRIVQCGPQRVIFNPGAENATLSQHLQTESIATEDACTLVLLNTGQF